MTGGQALDFGSFKNQDDRADSSLKKFLIFDERFENFESLKRGSRKVVFQFQVGVMQVLHRRELSVKMNIASRLATCGLT